MNARSARTIGDLMFLVAAVAVDLALISVFVFGKIGMIMPVVPIVAVVVEVAIWRSWQRRDESRRFWNGFALGCGSTLVLLAVGLHKPMSSLGEVVAILLAPVGVAVRPVVALIGPPFGLLVAILLMIAVQSLLCVVAGVAAGLLARRFAARRPVPAGVAVMDIPPDGREPRDLAA